MTSSPSLSSSERIAVRFPSVMSVRTVTGFERTVVVGTEEAAHAAAFRLRREIAARPLRRERRRRSWPKRSSRSETGS